MDPLAFNICAYYGGLLTLKITRTDQIDGVVFNGEISIATWDDNYAGWHYNFPVDVEISK